MKQKLQKYGFVIDLLIIALVTIYISFAAGMWHGFPIGTDAYAHLSKVKFMNDFWPQSDWLYSWANGMPMFLWYSIVPYLFLLAGKVLFGSYEWSMHLLSITSLIVMAISVYLLVREITKNRWASFVAALLLLSMPPLWGRMAMGEIPRLIATAFMPLTWWLLVKYHQAENKTHRLYFFALLGIALALSGHYIITGMTLLTIIVIAYCLTGFTRQFYDYLKDLFLPALVLAGFTVIPFLISAGLAQVFGEGFFGGESAHRPVNIISFIHTNFPLHDRLSWIDNSYGASLHWLVLPIVMVLLYLAIKNREKLIKVPAGWPLLKAFFFLSIIFALYGLAVLFGFPGNWYNASVPPTDCFYYLALTLPVLAGIAYHFAFPTQLSQKVSFIIIILSLGVVINLLYPYPDFNSSINNNYQFFNKEDTVTDELSSLPESSAIANYRYANNNSFVATWFNYDYPAVPQTRDYYSQALLNQNDKFWFENSTFALENNYPETEYLLDWMAVKWLSVSYPNFKYEKFTGRPDLFTPQGSNDSPIKEERFDLFEYQNARPIMEATNAKTILVIGDEASYRNLLFSLSQMNLGSDKLIPIQGNQFIDLYLLEELQSYDAVLIYNFSYIEKERAFTLLDSYVYQGGHLLIESAAILSKPEGVTAFLPAPVKTIYPGEFGQEWNLEAGSDQTDLVDVNLEDFGPAIYGENKDWGMLYADDDNLRENAQTILKNHGHTVVASMNHGQGRVIWSGINLFYHFNNYKNEGEKRFIQNILTDLTGLDQTEFNHEPGQLVSPEKRQITIDPNQNYTGVLIKENYFPNWNANYQVGSNSTKLTIHQAGLGMMYVQLPDNINENYTVNFTYHKSNLEWVFIVVSSLLFFWLTYHYLLCRQEKPAAMLKKPKNNKNKNKKPKWNPKHPKYQIKKEK
ncbi:MAG: glycosyltransferase family 39 protein [Patescibacteria group bacterium]